MEKEREREKSTLFFTLNLLSYPTVEFKIP